ncbi:RNA-directed DNA polymerase from transposon X-element [Paramuricea clavata]|uniref:RNA-directed DNA polymerase from transposon X-element n=1 Tax=Paramuricea clavata TaxID=317549 RepID=A0A7D9LDM3_PARCT|nr:RNA-directed DNA polymerase from transposon X-element [Paramuricea clavata]
MSEERRADLLADKESLQERSKNIQEDMLQVDGKSKQRHQQRKRQIALATVKERRVKRRKLGAGANCTLKSDVLCMSNEPDCPFRLSCTEDISKGTQLLVQVQSIKEASEKLSATPTEPFEFWSQVESLLELSHKTLQFINQLHLPPLYNYILEATDAGPGVGVSNVEV